MRRNGYIPQEAVAAMQRELQEQTTAALARAEQAEKIAINKDSDLTAAREAWQEGISMWKDRAEAADNLLRDCVNINIARLTKELEQRIRAHLEGK